MNTNLEKPLIFVPRARFLSLCAVVFLLCLSLIFLQISNYGTFATLIFFSMLLYYVSTTGLKIEIHKNKIVLSRPQISQDINLEDVKKINFSTESGGLQLLLHFYLPNSNSVENTVAINISGYVKWKNLVRLLISSVIQINPEVEIDPRILQEIHS